MTINIGSVLFNGVVSRNRPVDVKTCRGPNEASWPGRSIIILARSWCNPVILPTAGCLNLGIHIIDGGANMLGHVLGGGSVIDEGVNGGGENALGKVEGSCGLQVQGCCGISSSWTDYT